MFKNHNSLTLPLSAVLMLSTSMVFATDQLNGGLTDDEAYQLAIAMSNGEQEAYPPQFGYNDGMTEEDALAAVFAATAPDHSSSSRSSSAPQPSSSSQSSSAYALPTPRWLEPLPAPKPTAQATPAPESKAPQIDVPALAKYVVGQRTTITSTLNDLTGAIGFIDDPFWFKEQIPPQNLTQLVLDENLNYLEKHCARNLVDFNQVKPLFDHFWQAQRPLLAQFDAAYQSCHNLITNTPNDARDMEESANEEKRREYFASSGLVTQFAQLKTLIEQINASLLVTSVDALLQSPAAQQLMSTPAPVIPQPELEKKKPVITRPPLNAELIDFKNRLDEEYTSRAANMNNETVMVFGERLVTIYYGGLKHHIDGLWKMLGKDPSTMRVVSDTQPILELLEEVKIKEKLELNQMAVEFIQKVIAESFKRHNSNNYKLLLKGKEDQYDYFLIVATQVLRFYDAYKDDSAHKEKALNLVGKFFGQLQEQYNTGAKQVRCQTGMMGRTLFSHKATLDHLVEVYETKSE